MTYIINPMWFYWISVADKICEATCSLAILLFISFGYCIHRGSGSQN